MSWKIQDWGRDWVDWGLYWWLQKIKKSPRWLQTFTGWFLLFNPIFSLPLIYYLIYPFVKLEETKILGYIGIFVFLFVSFRYSLWGYSLLKGEKFPSIVKLKKIKVGPRVVQRGSRRLQIVVGFLYLVGSILLFILTIYLASFVRKIYPNLEYLVMLPFAFLIFISFLKGFILLTGRQYISEKTTIGYIIDKIKSKSQKQNLNKLQIKQYKGKWQKIKN